MTDHVKSFEDTVTISDTVKKDIVRNLSDWIIPTDILVKGIGKSVADVLVVSDNVAKGVGKSVADAAVVGESVVKGIGKSIAEKVEVEDVIVKGVGKSYDEGVVVGESVSKDVGKALAESVTVGETFSKVQYYLLTVTGGTGSGVYAEGAAVSIVADEYFVYWKGSDAESIDDIYKRSAVLTMPSSSAQVEAVYASIATEANYARGFDMTIQAGRYDFVIEQGAGFDRTLYWKDEDGNPINLTGYTAEMKIKVLVGAAETVVTLTDESGITLGGAEGTIDIALTSAQTNDMTFTWAYYDLELTKGGNTVRLVGGKIKLSKAVTK